MSGVHNPLEPMVYTPVSAVANLRRAVLISAVLSVVAIVICALVGHPLAGVFGALGLGLGAGNNWVLQRSVIARATGDVSKRRFNGSFGLRLGGTTLIAVVVALLVHPDGLAIFIGLALFHALMLVGAALPVFRSLRPTP
jgi:ATP synthase I subunit